MKRTLIYLTITVVILTLITTVLMFSTSGSVPVKIYWAVDCVNDNSCELILSSKNFIGEVEENQDPDNPVDPTLADNYTATGSILPSVAVTTDSVSDVPWYEYRSKITSVTLGGEDDEIVPASMYGWFYGMEQLDSIDFSYVDSYYSVNFSKLFYGCKSLRNLDLSPLRIPIKNSRTSEEVFSYTYLDTITYSSNTYLLLEYGLWTDSSNNYEYYYNEISTGSDTTYINTTPKYYYKINDGVLNLTSMETEGYEWNYEGSKAKWFDAYTGELTETITSVVANDFAPMTMYRLFADLTDLVSIDFGNIDSASTLDMGQLFSNCKKLKELDLSNVSTESVFDIPHNEPSDLFENCISLKEVTINSDFSFALSEGVWIDESGNSYSDGLIRTNINETYIRRAIYWGVDASKETLTISNEFPNKKYGGAYDYTHEDSLPSIPWKDYASTVKNIVIGSSNSKIEPISMIDWFKGFDKVETIDLSNIDGSKLTSLETTFSNMSKLKTLDLSVINLSKLEVADYMLYNCTSLESVNLSGFNPPNLFSIGGMFTGCSKLEEVDLSSITTTNVATYELFKGCTSLKTVNLSNMVFDPDNFEYEEDFIDMFDGCNKVAQVTVGPSNIGHLKTQLPVPNSEYIPGADGKWYDSELNGYLPSELSTTTIKTFYANSPKTISFFDYESGELLRSGTYAYGTKLKLPNDFTKIGEDVELRTKFISSDGQTFDDIVTTKTSTYTLHGYKSSQQADATEYNIGSEYVLENDTTLYVVFDEGNATFTSFTFPVPNERFGYIFEGWSRDQNDVSGLMGSITPNNTTPLNSTYYAIWKQITHEFIDNTASARFVLGVTKSLSYRIDGDYDKFVDLFIGNQSLTRNTHYTASSGSTVITFTEAGINYINSLEPGIYEVKATFDDTNAISVSNLTVANPGKYSLIIHYRYSGNRSNEKVFDDYSELVNEGSSYSVTSKSKEYYTFDKEVVNGTVGTSDVEVTVTYTPKNDTNRNDIADELETSNNNTNTNTNTNSTVTDKANINTNSTTTNNDGKKVEPSPKTRDDILTYIILELISLVVGVVIFIRIKAH